MASSITISAYARRHWKGLLWRALKDTLMLLSVLIASYSALLSFASSSSAMEVFFSNANNWLFHKGFVFLLIFVIYIIFIVKNWPRMRAIYHDERTDTNIIIEYADIFKQEGLKVIHTVDTFDTELDRIISRRSLNGAFLSLCEKHKTDLPSLLNRSLSIVQETETDSTLPGNKTRYPLGTTCALTVNDQPYVLVSFAHLQSDGSISINSQEYFSFLMRMWENLSKANVRQEEINVVVMGNKFVDLPSEYSTEQKIDIMVQTFFIHARQHNFCKTLRICVHENDALQVDFYHYPVILDHLSKRPEIKL